MMKDNEALLETWGNRGMVTEQEGLFNWRGETWRTQGSVEL